MTCTERYSKLANRELLSINLGGPDSPKFRLRRADGIEIPLRCVEERQSDDTVVFVEIRQE